MDEKLIVTRSEHGFHVTEERTGYRYAPHTTRASANRAIKAIEEDRALRRYRAAVAARKEST
jgi:hypothetical protein